MNIAIIGQGAWGSALADVISRTGHTPSFFGREIDLEKLSLCDALILAVPAQASREVLKKITWEKPLLITAKGIEQTTGLFQSDVVEEFLPNVPWTILSGPTFAEEVMEKLPCAAVLASKNDKNSLFWSHIFSHTTFRTYLQHDPLGVQIGGALKNVIAIASGILTGLGGSENARAALLTRGLAEIVRFGTAYGAKEKTFMGLSGVGDLILTATSEKSRNFSLGLHIGEKQMDTSKGVKEGVFTVSAVIKKAKEKDIFMPISQAVHQILTEKINPEKALQDLMTRPPKFE